MGIIEDQGLSVGKTLVEIRPYNKTVKWRNVLSPQSVLPRHIVFTPATLWKMNINTGRVSASNQDSGGSSPAGGGFSPTG